MELIWHPSPNYATGRRGYRPEAIIDHITAGAYPGCLTWLCNRDAQASCHYLITRKGVVYQLVRDEDTAWGCGVIQRPTWPLLKEPHSISPNLYVINIEHEAISPKDGIAEAQYQATLELHDLLCRRWGIPRDRAHITGHYQIDSVDRPLDPGPLYPWERLLDDLNHPDRLDCGPVIAEDVNFRYREQLLKSKGYIEDGRTMVPVRQLLEELGYQINWDGLNRIVDILDKE